MEIDISKFLGATNREVSSREHDGQPARVQVLSRTYPTTPADLWDALTNAERIHRWFLPITGDLRIGGRFQFEGNAGGEILACEPEKRISVTWGFGDMLSWVEVTLTPASEGTTLRLEHIAHVPSETWKQYGPGATGIGWEMGLLGLEMHITTGETVANTEETMKWMASDNGKGLIRASSDLWCAASIAAGTSEKNANAAAARCAAAYLGEQM